MANGKGQGLNKALDSLGDIGRFIADPLGLTKKGGGVDQALDRVLETGAKVNEQIKGMADATTGHVEDLLDASEGAQAGTTMILWIAAAAGAGIVIYLIYRAWR